MNAAISNQDCHMAYTQCHRIAAQLLDIWGRLFQRPLNLRRLRGTTKTLEGIKKKYGAPVTVHFVSGVPTIYEFINQKTKDRILFIRIQEREQYLCRIGGNCV